MTRKQTEVLIIGGGLTGLTLAYLLKKIGISSKIIEARKVLGGRIKTTYNKNEAPIELGATWLIDQQTSVLKLLKDLDLEVFEQHYGNTAIYHPNGVKSAQLVKLPENNNKSYRIKNGTHSVIKALSERIGKTDIHTNETIHSIELVSGNIKTKSNKAAYTSKFVVSTLPPLLFSKSIKTIPSLPTDILELMYKTHTWMQDSIRIGFTYKSPFWKTKRTTGTIYSSVGPIQEFYDHSSTEENVFALSGFINGTYASYSVEERKNAALKQLQSYYGDMALDYLNYEECVWKDEKFTATKTDSFLMPQTNNGHPQYKNSFLEGKLFISGAETSAVFPGKMEGAITSARHIFDKIRNVIK